MDQSRTWKLPDVIKSGANLELCTVTKSWLLTFRRVQLYTVKEKKKIPLAFKIVCNSQDPNRK